MTDIEAVTSVLYFHGSIKESEGFKTKFALSIRRRAKMPVGGAPSQDWRQWRRGAQVCCECAPALKKIAIVGRERDRMEHFLIKKKPHVSVRIHYSSHILWLPTCSILDHLVSYDFAVGPSQFFVFFLINFPTNIRL